MKLQLLSVLFTAAYACSPEEMERREIKNIYDIRICTTSTSTRVGEDGVRTAAPPTTICHSLGDSKVNGLIWEFCKKNNAYVFEYKKADSNSLSNITVEITPKANFNPSLLRIDTSKSLSRFVKGEKNEVKINIPPQVIEGRFEIRFLSNVDIENEVDQGEDENSQDPQRKYILGSEFFKVQDTPVDINEDDPNFSITPVRGECEKYYACCYILHFLECLNKRVCFSECTIKDIYGHIVAEKIICQPVKRAQKCDRDSESEQSSSCDSDCGKKRKECNLSSSESNCSDSDHSTCSKSHRRRGREESRRDFICNVSYYEIINAIGTCHVFNDLYSKDYTISNACYSIIKSVVKFTLPISQRLCNNICRLFSRECKVKSSHKSNYRSVCKNLGIRVSSSVTISDFYGSSISEDDFEVITKLCDKDMLDEEGVEVEDEGSQTSDDASNQESTDSSEDGEKSGSKTNYTSIILYGVGAVLIVGVIVLSVSFFV